MECQQGLVHVALVYLRLASKSYIFIREAHGKVTSPRLLEGAKGAVHSSGVLGW